MAQPPKKRALKPATPQMRKALENLADGLPATYHLVGRSQHGGFNNTYFALVRRGFIDPLGDCITEAGREVIGRTAPRA